MKSFMSAALQDTAAPNGSTPSVPNNSAAVPANVPVPSEPAIQEVPKTGENAVVVMQGPLGSVITEALNKSLSKAVLASPVQVPAAATESLTTQFVQANGQINNAPEFLNRISKSVGLVPATDEAPTAINTLLDCASKVDDIEFIMVGKVDSDPNPSQVPQKSILHIVNVDGTPRGEQIAIESVQVVVNYRKIKG